MAREVAPFKTERRASTLAGGQWERLARVRLRTLPSRRKDSRRRMAGGELRLGTEADHGCFARLHLHDDVPVVQGGSTPVVNHQQAVTARGQTVDRKAAVVLAPACRRRPAKDALRRRPENQDEGALAWHSFLIHDRTHDTPGVRRELDFEGRIATLGN